MEGFSIGCGCCGKFCVQKWVPKRGLDGIDRGIVTNGCTCTFTNPFTPFNGLAIVTRQPRAVQGPYGAPFTDEEPYTNPANWYGTSTDREFYTFGAMPLVFEDVVNAHSFGGDGSFFEQEFNIDIPPHLLVEFAESQPTPACTLLDSEDVAAIEIDTTYPEEYSEPETMMWPDVMGYNGSLIYDTREVINCKVVYSDGASGPFHVSPSDLPKTYAELGSSYSLADTQVAIYYNSALGKNPTSILSMTPDHTEGTAWSHGYVEGGDFLSGYHPTFLGQRTIRENYKVNRQGYFSNGFVGVQARCSAQYRNWLLGYRRLQLSSPSFEYQGSRLPAGVAQSAAPEVFNNGFPKALTTFNNGGFCTTAVACDAEWNTNLAFLQVTEPGETRFVRVQWLYAGTLPTGITAVDPPVKADSFGSSILSSWDGRRVSPTFFGNLTYNVEYAAASQPSGFYPVNAGNPSCTIGYFKGYEGAANPEALWKKVADFTSDLETQPGTTHLGYYRNTGHKLETSGTYAGYIMQSNGPLWPTTTVAFPGSGATFTREEIP